MAAAVSAAPFVVYTGLWFLGYIVFPDRAVSAAVASGGLFVAAVGSILAGIPPYVSFVAVAGSIVVWDLSSNAVTIGRELGRRAPTRHAELVHAGGSVCIGALGVGLATAGLLATAQIPRPSAILASPALIVAIVGILLLVFGLRRRV